METRKKSFLDLIEAYLNKTFSLSPSSITCSHNCNKRERERDWRAFSILLLHPIFAAILRWFLRSKYDVDFILSFKCSTEFGVLSRFWLNACVWLGSVADLRKFKFSSFLHLLIVWRNLVKFWFLNACVDDFVSWQLAVIARA